MNTSETPALPAYVRHHESPSGKIHYRFEASTRMRQAGFPIPYMRLGTDLEAAFVTYESAIEPVLNSWQAKRLEISIETTAIPGTLTWMHQEFQKTLRFKAVSPITKSNYNNAIRRCCNYVMPTGRFAGQRFGDIPMNRITAPDADDFYAAYLVIGTTIDADGNTVEILRPGAAKYDVETLRTMVNEVSRRYEQLLHKRTNPFRRMHMPHHPKGAPPVVYEWLIRFLEEADARGLWSVSAIVLFCWETMVRVSHFPYTMTVADFRGPNHENQVRVVAHKVRKEAYFYLENRQGKPLYRELSKRLAKLKGKRTSGPLFVCERSEPNHPRPWRVRELRKVVAEICAAARIPHCTLTQFRTGGLTESGEAGLSPWQIMSQSLHDDPNTLKRYIERNARLAMGGRERRIDYRRQIKGRRIDM